MLQAEARLSLLQGIVEVCDTTHWPKELDNDLHWHWFNERFRRRLVHERVGDQQINLAHVLSDLLPTPRTGTGDDPCGKLIDR